MANFQRTFTEYQSNDITEPLYFVGDVSDILKEIPDQSIDCCITSPPYWGQRQYSNGGIGLEKAYEEYISRFLSFTLELRRVLKDTGSFWLNIGDTYRKKSLLAIPWRIAISMVDTQGWTLRNSIIWNKHKGGLDSSKDRLRNVHENIFHFVKNEKTYYYNDDAIRITARKTMVKNGAVVSATGVTGKRYKRHRYISRIYRNREKTH